MKQPSHDLWLSLCLSVGVHVSAAAVLQHWGASAKRVVTTRSVGVALEVFVVEPASVVAPTLDAKVSAASPPVAPAAVAPPTPPPVPVPPPVPPTPSVAESRPQPNPSPVSPSVPPTPPIAAGKARVDPSAPAPPPTRLEPAVPAKNRVASRSAAPPAASRSLTKPASIDLPAAVAGPSAPVITPAPTATVATNSATGSTPADVGQFTISLPEYRSNPAPIYPDSARRKRQEGVVWLMVEVGEQGETRAVAVERTSGQAALDEAAVTAVRGWKFAPARQGDRPVAARVEVPVRFRLGD